MRRIFLAVTLVASMASIMAISITSESPAPEGQVQWLTFEEAMQKSKTEKRKIFIDVYTDWCGWCKVMDKNTFSDPAVSKLLNEKFYAVKFNAEQREDVIFNGTTFKFVESGRSGYHEFAAALLNNQLSYPTVVLVEEDFKSVSPVPGYKKPDEVHKMLTYFVENHYKKGEAGRAEFEKTYKSPYSK